MGSKYNCVRVCEATVFLGGEEQPFTINSNTSACLLGSVIMSVLSVSKVADAEVFLEDDVMTKSSGISR